MNALKKTAATGEAGILRAALQALQGHGLKAEIARAQPKRGQVHADAFVRVRHGTEAALYAAEVKRWLTPANLGAIVARLRAFGRPALLVTDYVTPPVAEQLKALDVAFADAAGNAYLRGKTFLVWVTGRRLTERPHAPRAQRAYQPTGLKLLFALLCNPAWIDLNYRELAMRAGVAHGTVGWVMRDLVQDGFLIETGGRRARTRRLRNRRVLLDRWVEAYLRTLRPQMLLGRYQADKPDWWKALDPLKYGALLGGEPAAAVLTEYLKPGVVTLYLNGVPGNLIVDHRLRAAKDGNVEIRQRFWAFEYDWNHPTLTPPLLIYADLLGTGDARCIETARRIFDGHLARLVAED
jgi:hypothetical protein